jgi:putative DNA methylase
MTDQSARPEPFALKDAPALIEAVFPAQKISFEAQRERKAGAGQTLTALGSYWKGRKPLILVRAIVLGSLLPQTDDPEKDLEIFEKLMAFDDGGLARRALANNAFKPDDMARSLALDDPWKYFTYKIQALGPSAGEVSHRRFPLDPGKEGIRIRWRKECTEAMKLDLYARMLAHLPDYETRAGLCKRPEELDQTALFSPIWPAVNAHLGHLGIKAHSHQELVEQLGILRFGHRPRVGDTFCGGWLDSLRSGAVGLRCLCLGSQSHRLHVDLGGAQHHRRLAREAGGDRAGATGGCGGGGSGDHGAGH